MLFDVQLPLRGRSVSFRLSHVALVPIVLPPTKYFITRLSVSCTRCTDVQQSLQSEAAPPYTVVRLSSAYGGV